ncbi:hypothetical protein KP509_22G043600 [Ceratopteris richardii]|uniref:inorganic diphosphatase n=1 Tax=Ceratopteris richardii TaxID=49495 RepID=A0A8T2S6F7_CERRI|nr:hypothetical protein KP509_22G043600 [Ceratopteris richardii]KAH7307047.1 hypothetical protein KP509_22G043600 [Ceratopteris richardii]
MLSIPGPTISSVSFPCFAVYKAHQKTTREFVDVVIEVPKGSIVKRRPDGSVDFLLPCPCPFNYGSVISTSASDGDPLDAVVLGGHLPYGHIGTWRVKGLLKFVDAGVEDDKLVCIQTLPETDCLMQQIVGDFSIFDLLALSVIFTVYSQFKHLVNVSRGMQGMTTFIGWEPYE